jgi:pyruvyltransferase
MQIFIIKLINKIKRISIIDTIAVLFKKKSILFWSGGKENDKNFGDAINPLLFEKATKLKVVNLNNIVNFYKRPVYYFIGSLLDNLNKSNAIICGTGFQNENAIVLKKPAKIIAVRGPLSRNIFLKHNIECPEVYCDPALLLPSFYMPENLEKKYDVGIIAHYIDKEMLNQKKIINNGLTYHFIDIETDWEKIIDEINMSRYIISSSLHGIIVAHAYNIPAGRIKLSNNIIGGDFKFNDYALSMDIKPFDVYHIKNEIDLDIAIKQSTLVNTKPAREKFINAIKGL